MSSISLCDSKPARKFCEFNSKPNFLQAVRAFEELNGLVHPSLKVSHLPFVIAYVKNCAIFLYVSINLLAYKQFEDEYVLMLYLILNHLIAFCVQCLPVRARKECRIRRASPLRQILSANRRRHNFCSWFWTRTDVGCCMEFILMLEQYLF